MTYLPKKMYFELVSMLWHFTKFRSSVTVLKFFEINIHVSLDMYRKQDTDGIERETSGNGVPSGVFEKKSAHMLGLHTKLYVYTCRRAYSGDRAGLHGAEKDLPRCRDIFVFWSAGSAVYHPQRKCGPRRFLVCH